MNTPVHLVTPEEMAIAAHKFAEACIKREEAYFKQVEKLRQALREKDAQSNQTIKRIKLL